MSQAAKAPKTEKPATAAQIFPFPTFDLTKFEMPKFDGASFDFAKAEVPAAMREATEKAVAQIKDGYAKMKAAAEETTDLVEDTYSTASAGVKDFNLKALEAARSNMNAGFDHARDLMGAKSLAEVIELQTAYARKLFETVQTQGKDLSAVVQKTATETVEPVKEKVGKVLKTAAI
ncbi:MAG: phasin [Phreatobacter sp.]|uniref:phasin n=1 Tax=Phreatobacter sp. TaxID=1966341 RepID=UPI002733DF67|nr:phasin [Phreatobacter sp.]MDP2802859.1 phasin [Phreatobacter sp.]